MGWHRGTDGLYGHVDDGPKEVVSHDENQPSPSYHKFLSDKFDEEASLLLLLLGGAELDGGTIPAARTLLGRWGRHSML